jgi:hypothetical protein
MRFDLRIALPAALAAAALALPGSSSADPPITGACPDGYLGPFLIGPAFPDKDKNHDQMLCVKMADMNLVFKDDNCNPHCSQADLLDNPTPNVDTLVDDAL